jgi:hypothetical protein
MPDERRRRNVRPEIARARATLGSLIARGASPAEIQAARQGLQVAKARAAVRELLHLPDAERMQLAGMLLAGGGDDAAA